MIPPAAPANGEHPGSVLWSASINICTKTNVVGNVMASGGLNNFREPEQLLAQSLQQFFLPCPPLDRITPDCERPGYFPSMTYAQANERSLKKPQV